MKGNKVESSVGGPGELVDPLAHASFGAVSLYSQRFDSSPGGQALTPQSVGLYAGLARLESLLQREVVSSGMEKEEYAFASATPVSPPSPVSPDPGVRSLQSSLRACLTPPPWTWRKPLRLGSA